MTDTTENTTQNNSDWQKREIGALWRREGKNQNYLSGKITLGDSGKEKTFQFKDQGEDFDYILLCNKICGGGHWNMGIKFIVETQEEFDEWYASQQSLGQQLLTQK